MYRPNQVLCYPYNIQGNLRQSSSLETRLILEWSLQYHETDKTWNKQLPDVVAWDVAFMVMETNKDYFVPTTLAGELWMTLNAPSGGVWRDLFVERQVSKALDAGYTAWVATH